MNTRFTFIKGISCLPYVIIFLLTFLVQSLPGQDIGVSASGIVVSLGVTDQGSPASIGVFGRSAGSGYSTNDNDSIGVQGSGVDFGVKGESLHGGIGVRGQGHIGGQFRGSGGIAIELEGSDSPWGEGSDDCVIRTDILDSGGDMIMVSGDNFHVHLDDDDISNASSFVIFSGTNSELWSISESGSVNLQGVINGSSDVHRKENFRAIDHRGILKKVAELPISEWQFKGDSIRHLGPTAQDFYSAFGLGEGETTIATLDADGIALAAIQELTNENQKLREENMSILKHLEELETQMYQIREYLNKGRRNKNRTRN